MRSQSADSAWGRRGKGRKSKAKRRCVSFNQAELQRNKTKGMSGELGRETRTHIRRMSVDVGLFLGQKGLQVRNAGGRRGSSEGLNPTRGATLVTKETESSNNSVAAGERESKVVEEKASTKHGRKKKSSKKLKRSFRLGSTEEEDVISDQGSSQTRQLQQQQRVPSPSSQIPPPKSRQGSWFRSSLRKTSSEESASGMATSGSMVSMVSVVEVKDKPGGSRGGKMEKKSKFGVSFPGGRWSWKLRKTQNETEPVTDDPLPQCLIKEEEGEASFEGNPVEDLLSSSPTSMAQTGDSWHGNAPNRAFSPSPASNKTHSKSFIGIHTHNQSFTKQTPL